MKAGLTLGLSHSEEPDRSARESIGRAVTTTFNGRRHSAADAFLTPARHRSNLSVRVDAPVQRLLFKQRRADGVVYGSGSAARTAHCRREIIVSAGTVNSPRLLIWSGIGPGNHLRRFRIEVIADLPGVGANLHDHSMLGVAAAVQPQLSINRELRGVRKLSNGLRWLLTQRSRVRRSAPSRRVARCSWVCSMSAICSSSPIQTFPQNASWPVATWTWASCAHTSARRCCKQPRKNSGKSVPASRTVRSAAGITSACASKVVNKYKVGKHFALTIEESDFQFHRIEQQVAAEAALDGLYVIRTSVPKKQMDSAEAVRSYKALAEVAMASTTPDRAKSPSRYYDACDDCRARST